MQDLNSLIQKESIYSRNGSMNDTGRQHETTAARIQEQKRKPLNRLLLRRVSKELAFRSGVIRVTTNSPQTGVVPVICSCWGE